MKNDKLIPERRAAKPSPAAETAVVQINRLADAFTAADPDAQHKGLAAMDELIGEVEDEASRDWLIHFRRTFEFLQRNGGEQ